MQKRPKLGVGGGSSLCLVNGGVLAGTNGEVKVMGGACLAVTNATVAVDAAPISVAGSGSSVLLKDATLTMTNAVFNFGSQSTFLAQDSSVSICQSGDTYCSWQGRQGFDNCTIVYPRVQLQAAGAELAFTNTVARGGRIEMTKSSTVRLHNSQVYLGEPHATCIFMMGASDAGDNYERHVYISGSNTYVQATKGTSQFSGLYVRGSNTTLHVSIPAEGLSKDHPLFEFKTLSFQTDQQRLRVEIDADGQLGLNGGGTYTLFKGTGASTIKVNYIYNPNDIAVTKQDFDGYSEVYVRVRSKRGMVLLIK